MGERLLCKQEVIGSIPFTSIQATGYRGRVTETCNLSSEKRLFFNNLEEVK